MKVSRILCIIGLCILVPFFIFLLVFPKCSNINTASAYEVEDNTLGYVSTILDGGYFYFDNEFFDDELKTPSKDDDLPSVDHFSYQPSLRTVLPSSINFTPGGTFSYLTTQEGILANYTTVGSYSFPFDDNYGFNVVTQKFKPNNSNTDPYLYFTTNRYYSFDTFLSAYRHFEIGRRTNNIVNYKLDMTITNVSSTHTENGVTVAKSININTNFLKYISLKDYINRGDLLYLFDYDYNNNDNTINTNVALFNIQFRLYMYDPSDNNLSGVFFSSSIESFNGYTNFINNNVSEIFNYTVINNPSPVDIIFDGVYAFFMLEVFPSFYLYYIIAIALGGVMVGMVLKLFLGG